MLRDATSLLPLLRRGTNDMEGAIRAGVARLFSMQTQSGGLGYWPRAKEPMLWASAYGGMVLALAQRHGVGGAQGGIRLAAELPGAAVAVRRR